MKYELVLELVDDNKRFKSFKDKIIGLSHEAGKKFEELGNRIPNATNCNTWKKQINDYAEFVNDLERYVNTLHNDKTKYKPKGFVRSFDTLVKDIRHDEWLEQIGYKGNYINAAEIARIIYDFFTSDKYTRNSFDQETSIMLNNTNNKLEKLLKSRPSVKTK